MRLVTLSSRGEELLGFVMDSKPYSFPQAVAALGGWERLGVKAAPFSSMLSLIEAGPEAWKAAQDIITAFSRLEEGEREKAAHQGELLAPIPRPRKNLLCVGRNYAEHAKERGADAPQHPVFFTKAPTTVVGPDARVPYPAATSQFDYEGELAVIIGRGGRDIPKEQAEQHIFGYTIANDLTARDLQKRHQQFFRGKSLDYTCPLGPWIVTADELESVNHLQLETRVNGEVRQSGSTAEMIFDIPTLIHVLSDGMTLEPGDIILTGTPAGVGAALGKLLQPGDRIDVSITGIGTLTTYIVAP